MEKRKTKIEINDDIIDFLLIEFSRKNEIELPSIEEMEECSNLQNKLGL